MDRGVHVDVRTAAPSFFRKLVRDSIGRMIRKEWATAPSAANDRLKSDPGGYWTAELCKLTAGARKD